MLSRRCRYASMRRTAALVASFSLYFSLLLLFPESTVISRCSLPAQGSAFAMLDFCGMFALAASCGLGCSSTSLLFWQNGKVRRKIKALLIVYDICVGSLWSLDRVGFFQIFHTHILVGGASLSRGSSFLLLFKALCSGKQNQRRVKLVLPCG